MRFVRDCYPRLRLRDRISTTRRRDDKPLINLAIFVWAFCLLGSCWQIFEISHLYFSYPSAVEMKLERPPQLTIPAISICAPTGQLANRSSLRTKHPDISDEMNRIERDGLSQNLSSDVIETRLLKVIQKMIQKLRVKEMEQVTVGVDSVIEFCGAARPMTGKYSTISEPRILCSMVAEVKTHYFAFSKCFTLFGVSKARLDEQSSEPYVVDRDFIEVLIFFKLRHSFMRHGFVIFHPPDEPPRYSRNNWVGIYPEKQQKIFLSFTKTEVRLLPKPYATKCKDYNRDGYKSREQCIDDCFVKRYREVEGRWPAPVAAVRQEQLIVSDMSNYTNYGEISKWCNAKCGRQENCLNVYYDVQKYLNVWRKPGEDEEGFQVIVMSPRGMDTTYKHNAKIQLIEYICYVASLLSLWFGASAKSLFGNVDIVMFKKRSKKRDKNVENSTDIGHDGVSKSSATNEADKEASSDDHRAKVRESRT